MKVDLNRFDYIKYYDEKADGYEEAYMWIGKAIRDDQVERNSTAFLVPNLEDK